MGGTEIQGISRVGPTVLVRLMESQACLPCLWLCPGRAQKRDNSLFPPFCLRENCPPAPILMPVTSVPPCMPLVPFKLLPWCWSSEQVSLNKSICGFFKVNCLELQKFLPPAQSLLVFASRSYGDLSSWHRNPGLRGPSVGLGLLLRYKSQSLIHHMWLWDQPVSCVHPSYQSRWMSFL